MKKINKKSVVLTIILYICSALFMNGFYKCLSGFVANKFNDPFIMMTMIISYILPVFCFLVFFYNYYVKRIPRVVTLIYSTIVVGVALFSLGAISKNFALFASNNNLGVYGSIPSIIVKFPYDMIIVDMLLIMIQGINIFSCFSKENKITKLKNKLYNLGYLKIHLVEYLAFCILAILALFTVGDFICGLQSIGNMFYDIKYLFLLLWILIIPTLNLLSLVFQIEKREIFYKYKIIYLSLLIAINILFAVLLILFEIIDPNFVVNVGKPLFPIAFSVSIPIELFVILGIQAVSIIIDFVKLLIVILKRIIKKQEF